MMWLNMGRVEMNPSIRIEIQFSSDLHKTVNKAKSDGEVVDVVSVIHNLFSNYKKGFTSNPQFVAPLKKLDKNVKIEVIANVNGKTLK